MSAIQHAAERLAAAEVALAAAQTAHQTAQGEADRRQGRLDALQGELAAIAERRQAGDAEESDAARVSLLRLDIEGLEPLVRDATQAAHTTQQEVDSACNRLSIAQGELARATAHEQVVALENRLHEIEALLCQGISQLVRLKQQANPRFIAVASQVYQPGALLDRFIKYGQIPG